MAPDPASIRNFQRLDPRITTSGRLTDDDLAGLAAIGVRHVINLALDDHPEALADEAAKLAAHGIGYTHIPIPFDRPGAEHYDAFAAALAAAGDGPVHVHCIMNYRVSALFYRWHREAAGMAESRARELLEVQWSPHRSDRADARAWAKLIGITGS